MGQILLLVSIGLFAGMLSGVVGVGGGIFVVPALVFFLGLSQHNAQGTSLALLMTPVGIFAVYNYYKEGYVNVPFALFIAIGFIAGAYFGSKLALKMPDDIIRKVFAGFMILVAVKMLLTK